MSKTLIDTSSTLTFTNVTVGSGYVLLGDCNWNVCFDYSPSFQGYIGVLFRFIINASTEVGSVNIMFNDTYPNQYGYGIYKRQFESIDVYVPYFHQPGDEYMYGNRFVDYVGVLCDPESNPDDGKFGRLFSIDYNTMRTHVFANSNNSGTPSDVISGSVQCKIYGIR